MHNIKINTGLTMQVPVYGRVNVKIETTMDDKLVLNISYMVKKGEQLLEVRERCEIEAECFSDAMGIATEIVGDARLEAI